LRVHRSPILLGPGTLVSWTYLLGLTEAPARPARVDGWLHGGDHSYHRRGPTRLAFAAAPGSPGS
jgi:hypothetical protein